MRDPGRSNPGQATSGSRPARRGDGRQRAAARRLAVGLWLILLPLTLSARLQGQGRYRNSPAKLPEIVANSQVVFVGRLLSVPSSSMTGGFPGRPPLAPEPLPLKFDLERVVSSANPAPASQVTVFEPSAIPFGADLVGQRYLVFATTAGGNLVFVSDMFPFVALRDERVVAGSSLLNSVEATLARLLADRANPFSYRNTALQLLATDSGDGRTNDWLAGTLTDPDPSLRNYACLTLVGRGDARALPVLRELFSDPLVPIQYRALFLDAIAFGDWNTPDFLPFVRQLAQSPTPQDRAAGVEAAARYGTAELPLLGAALDDPGQRVRYAAVVGLAKVAQRPDWRPGSAAAFAAHEQVYIRFWKQWLAQNPAVGY